MSWVAILMSSDSDWRVMSAAKQVLNDLGIEVEVRITSAYRTPEDTISYVKDAQSRRCAAFICGAGTDTHLVGAVAAHTVRPVIGVPIGSGALNGADTLLSTVQMPAGIPVAMLATGKVGAKNAGYLAAQILAVADAQLSKRLQAQRAASAAKVKKRDAKLQASLNG